MSYQLTDVELANLLRVFRERNATKNQQEDVESALTELTTRRAQLAALQTSAMVALLVALLEACDRLFSDSQTDGVKKFPDLLAFAMDATIDAALALGRERLAGKEPK